MWKALTADSILPYGSRSKSSDTISIEVVLHLALGPFAVPKKLLVDARYPGNRLWRWLNILLSS